jgi:DNA processing protein
LRSHRVGPVTFHRLIAEFGTAGRALEELPRIAEEAGLKAYRPAAMDGILHEMDLARQAGARPLPFGAADYPADLAAIPDPPPFLWTIGDRAHLTRPMIALVGARNASSLGTRMAKRMAAELGEAGFVVVSGLARGIDTAAHGAALETGTVAVFAGGVDVVYPAQNAVLAQEIAERGLTMSEQPMSVVPQARHFPRRNRIVSGLARAVVVVEAAAKSGTLGTARGALDQGREVFAVPGHPFDARAAGCNMLLRDGATLVRGARDVIEALEAAERPDAGPVTASVPVATPARGVTADMVALHGQILDRLGPAPLPEDDLLRAVGVDPGVMAPLILSMELEGKVAREAGGLIRRLV